MELRRSRLAPAAILLAAALASPGPLQADEAGPEAQGVKRERIGRSVEGRPIRATRIGDPGSRRTAVVFGCIHGDECAGHAVVRRLVRERSPANLALWIVKDLNPDGERRGTRQNAHGVDLNRNFPRGWRSSAKGSRFYSGRRPLSEPESRAAVELIKRVDPGVTIWYHQPLALIYESKGADPRLLRRYARAVDLPAQRLGKLPGTATGWQNHRDPGTSAFVVELAGGSLSSRAAKRHARAALDVAVRRSPSRQAAPTTAGALLTSAARCLSSTTSC